MTPDDLRQLFDQQAAGYDAQWQRTAPIRESLLYLLGAVFERFLARYVSINSFTETVLRTTERGEVMRWQAQPGRRPNI